MRFMKTTAVALTLTIGGVSAPISSPFTATDAEAAHRSFVRKTVIVKPHGRRFVSKRVIIRRPGVRVVGGRYWYGGHYYDHDAALAAGLLGFTAGAVIGGALAY